MPAPTTSSRPRSRPDRSNNKGDAGTSSAPTRSPRPRSRPDRNNNKSGAGGGLAGFLDSLAAGLDKFNGPTGRGGSLNAGQAGQRSARRGANESGQPSRSTPPPGQDPGEVAKRRPTVAADTSVLTRALRDRAARGGGSYRGSVLSSLYNLPQDGARAVRTLQTFNGGRGDRLKLGS